MKKLFKILIITIILSTFNVYAKDTVYSVQKYTEEKLITIEPSYDKDSKVDGNVAIGTFLKEKVEKDDEEYDNHQVMLIKYKTSGKVAWTYRYGRTSTESVDALLYTYASNNKIDGYLMAISNSYDILTETTPKSYFVKIDLNGKLVFEKEIDSPFIRKLIPTYSIDDVVDGYIGITDKSIVKYDKELNLIYKKDLPDNINYLDIIDIYNDNNVIGYAFLVEEMIDNKPVKKIITYNSSLTESNTIVDNIELEEAKLSTSTNGFILYGITNEVKLKKSDRTYHVIKYTSTNEEEWESIGSIPLSDDSNIVLKNVKDKYFVLYKNVDNSYEVVKLDDEGLFKKKIKKINNSYYNFINFSIYNEKELYFVGLLTCPEDEKCNYESNSLYLVSDEDKVIEVQDSTSANILVGIVVLIIGGITIVYILKSRSIKNKKK